MGNANEGSSMTQIDAARAGTITREMAIVAEKEGRDPEFIREGVAAGRIAIPANIHHTSLSPEGVGGGLRTKVNVNLGISGDVADEAEEWKKVDVALELGAEAIMDLSNTGKTHAFRSALIEKSPAMIGTVPMYDAIGYLEKPLITITVEDFLDVVRAHAEDGVDFVTIHAGMNRRTIESFRETGRLTNIVSRGGSLIFAWMEATGNENPFYEFYDEVLAILHEHDVTISLGDAMRPGSSYDATDAGQIAELIEIGKLTKRAWDAGVQVMVEGPGHMALDEIAANMKLEKRLCHDAPFYVLGPLVTDIAPGYDHITAAIGRGCRGFGRRLPLLRHAGRASAPARRRRRARGPRGHEDRRACGRHRARGARSARPRQPHERRSAPRGLGGHVRRGARSGQGAPLLRERSALDRRHLHHVRRDVRHANREHHHGRPDGRSREGVAYGTVRFEEGLGQRAGDDAARA